MTDQIQIRTLPSWLVGKWLMRVFRFCREKRAAHTVRSLLCDPQYLKTLNASDLEQIDGQISLHMGTFSEGENPS